MAVEYDDKNKTFVCDEHGNIGKRVGLIECTSCGGNGGNDRHGFSGPCFECFGKGGWIVCGTCHADDSEVEWVFNA